MKMLCSVEIEGADLSPLVQTHKLTLPLVAIADKPYRQPWNGDGGFGANSLWHAQPIYYLS